MDENICSKAALVDEMFDLPVGVFGFYMEHRPLCV